MSPILLATDLDGTLVGDDRSLRELNSLIEQLRSQQRLKLAYVTGRSPELYNELKVEKRLLDPDALITAVGTEIYARDQRALGGWPNVSNWDPSSMHAQLVNIPSLELQPSTEQRQYKLSYFLKDKPDIVGKIQEMLQSCPVDVIYSMGLYIDIVPKGINKGSALRFLADRWGIEGEAIVACGDSGNDVAMLQENKAIVVGNAKNELLEWVAKGPHNDLYLAKSNYAMGIIEGLKHFRLIT